ncbi:MAG TPA: CinA family nicotinamide mononucleotide deamidase-related protein [Desulfobacteraceae bacterium]|nr:CinA family nicotinamide mononucleotide deamidase-related protein [Desulfobacteraceae bacterium]
MSKKTTFHSPTCEIITIGTELLLGQIIDTNTAYLAQELGELGISVRFRTSVGDHLGEIIEVVRNGIERCDMVVTTGGLGPTADDLTRDAVAGVAGVALAFSQDLMDQIEGMFRKFGYKMPENNRKQAYVPQGSLAVPNPAGTAPAFITEIEGRPVISLPGVPRELKYLMKHAIVPWLRKRYHLHNNLLHYRVLKVVGLGESAVDRVMGDLIKPGKNPEVGLLASPGEIKIRVAATASDREDAERLIEPVVQELRKRLGNKILGEDKETLESVILGLLKRNNLTVSLLETFTGGSATRKMNSFPAKSVRQSLVCPNPADLSRVIGEFPRSLNKESSLLLAARHRAKTLADVSLAILGFLHQEGNVFSIEAHAAAEGRGVEKYFSWRMSGDLPMLQERGGIIGLNTLRLALLEITK